MNDDPLAPILKPVVRSSVDVLLGDYRQNRRYKDEDFPMGRKRFASFRKDMIESLAKTLGLEEWVVCPTRKSPNPLGSRFRDRVLDVITHHGIRMEVHLIGIPETGDRIPAVICLPRGTERRPGVCVFSGHSRHGLRDLVLDVESYQRGIATRLAKAGFVSVAVEKIDCGYLARNFGDGVDEKDIAVHRLAWGRTTRAHQLMACLAATEILTAHPRVDAKRIGATGVSLGGWLSVQTGLLSDRIKAVADFGRKTLFVPPDVSADRFEAASDFCQILPGMLRISARNLISLAWCPRPMLAGHGRADEGSRQQGLMHYKRLFQDQYRALNKANHYSYHVHSGGDTMPERAVLKFFREQFCEDE